MKKVVWITENFIDVDLPIIQELSNYYDITWIISHRKLSEYYTEKETYQIAQLSNVKTIIRVSKSRYRDPYTAMYYAKLLFKARSLSPDIFYVDLLGAPFFYPIASILLPKKKVIYAAHDVVEHVGLKNRSVLESYKRYIFRKFENFHIFSSSQAKYFEQIYPKKKYFTARLALKDYGISGLKEKPEDKIVFLFFGSIRENKGLKLFIEVMNALNDKYPDKIKIIIAGQCDDWEKYDKLIKDRSIYELNISLIPNSLIPDLFTQSHYIVLPYLDVTQSGVIMVAYKYGLPAIASDFEEFRNDIIDGETGYLFEANNLDKMKEKIEYIINNHQYNYFQITGKLSKYIDNNISTRAIAEKYKLFFDSL